MRAGKLSIIETRVLLHRNKMVGWLYPMSGAPMASDAELKVGGARDASCDSTMPGGHDGSISYAVPNKNQCKQCHSEQDEIVPIGPIWQNMSFRQRSGRKTAADWVLKLRKGLYAHGGCWERSRSRQRRSALAGLSAHQLRPLPRANRVGEQFGSVF